jgi:DNA polymerase-4
LPGLGPATERALSGLGISTLGQLAALPLDTVQRRVGRASGTSLWERAQGIDTGPVTVPGAPRSVSREETFARDVAHRDALHARIGELASDVGARLRTGGWTARTVTLKLRYSDFTTITRQETLASATATDTTVRDAALALLDTAWSGDAVRLLGVGVSGLADAPQLDLFAQPANDRIDHTLDRLRQRFGQGAIRRGTGDGLHDLDWRGDDLRR